MIESSNSDHFVRDEERGSEDTGPSDGAVVQPESAMQIPSAAPAAEEPLMPDIAFMGAQFYQEPAEAPAASSEAPVPFGAEPAAVETPPALPRTEEPAFRPSPDASPATPSSPAAEPSRLLPPLPPLPVIPVIPEPAMLRPSAFDPPAPTSTEPPVPGESNGGEPAAETANTPSEDLDIEPEEYPAEPEPPAEPASGGGAAPDGLPQRAIPTVLPEPVVADTGPAVVDGGSRGERLAAALTELIDDSDGVRAAAVISLDGFIIASALPADMQEDRVAAMSAAILALGERAARELGRGRLTQVFIEGDDGYVMLMAAGERAVLTCLAGRDVKLGLVIYDMRRSARLIGEVVG